MNKITITVGGKKRTLLLSIRTIREMKIKGGIDVLSDGDLIKNDVSNFYANLLYYAALTYCQRNDIEPDFTLDDAWDWIDELGFASPKMTEIMELFNRSITGDVPKKKKSETPKGMPLKKGK